MSRRSRTFYTEGQRAVMWERWRAGDSLQQISQLFDRHRSSVRVSSRQAVDAFHAAAIAAGGKDNGAPGLRPQYHAN